MEILTIKILLAPLFIVFTYLIQKRYGARLGGVFMALLPFIALPILMVLYLQQGSDFFNKALIGTYAGQIGLLLFIFFYTKFARKYPWYICVIVATTSYLTSVFILSLIISTLLVGIVAWIVVWFLIMRTFTAYDITEVLSSSTWRDLLIRVISALLLIFTITAFAGKLGPQYAGALATYPILTSIMSTFNHYRYGANSAIAVMHGVTQYLFVTTLFIFPALSIFF